MPDIVQHCFGAPGGGGPATALQRLTEASARAYPTIWQSAPAGGISVRYLWLFVRQLRRHRPRLVHVRGLGNEGFHAALAARLAGVPHVLVSIHGTQRDLRQGSGGLRRWIVTRLLEPATLRLASAVTTVCGSAAERDFLRPYRTKMLPPVPNGVVLPLLPDSRGDAVREALAIPPDRPVAVTVSRLTLEKGYGDLAAALRLLGSREPAIELIVVGSGDADGAIRDRFQGLRSTRVHFVGQQADVGPYLAAADLFVFPSWHENLSNALLEAMSYGLPVVATNVGGNQEVVAQGGGLLVPPHDPERLAAALDALLSQPERRRLLGRAARETIERQYSVEQMVAGWEHTYRQILDRRS